MGFWDSNMHKPIVAEVYLPAFNYQPWFFKGTAWVEKLERNLRDAFKEDKDGVPLLKTLFETSAKIPNYSAQEVKHLLLEQIQSLSTASQKTTRRQHSPI